MAAVTLNARGGASGDRAVWWSVAGHVLLLILVLIGGFSLPHTPPQTQLAIKATVVESPTNRRARTTPAPVPKLEAAPEPTPAPKPERKPEPKPEPKVEKAPPPRVEPKPDPAIAQRKAEQLKQEREKAADAARREKAEKAAEKQRQEKAAADRARAEAEKQKAAQDKAAADRQQAAKVAAARELDRQLEEEGRLLEAADSGALADYQALITQRVARNWIRPPGATAGLECVLSVTQIPGGEVVAVSTERCNADAAVRRSIEAAVLKSSPLPLPDDPALFDRNLRFTFKPEQ